MEYKPFEPPKSILKSSYSKPSILEQIDNQQFPINIDMKHLLGYKYRYAEKTPKREVVVSFESIKNLELFKKKFTEYIRENMNERFIYWAKELTRIKRLGKFDIETTLSLPITEFVLLKVIVPELRNIFDFDSIFDVLITDNHIAQSVIWTPIRFGGGMQLEDILESIMGTDYKELLNFVSKEVQGKI